MKKVTKKLLTLMLAFAMAFAVCAPAVPVTAASNQETQSAVMKVMWAYVTDSGVVVPIKFGTSFLINDTTAITNYHCLVFLTVEEKNEAIEYLNREYGTNLTDLAENNNHFHVYVMPNRDTTVDCTIDDSAFSAVDRLDFAVLHLNKSINRTPVTFGDSDTVEITDQVFAYGFPADSIENKEENTIEDVSVVAGSISKITTMPYADVFEHSAQLTNGNSGGPLVNSNYEVIGINEFIQGDKNYSVQINQIKSILDTYNIQYNEGSTAVAVDKAALNSAVSEAEGKDLSAYEDTSALSAALTKAKEVAANPDATQDDVNAAASELTGAIGSLKLKDAQEAPAETPAETPSQPNATEEGGFNYLYLIIGVAAIALIAVIIGLIMSRAKSGSSSYGGGSYGGPSGSSNLSGADNSYEHAVKSTSTVPTDQGTTGTTMLDNGNDSTTFLNMGEEGGAYLIRKKTGERIVLSNSNFVIGKQKSNVDYCITDNTAISRRHAIIEKRGDDYYLNDQNSTNCSYVNGAKAYPNTEVVLPDNAVIKLADEEFEFYKG